LSGTPKHSSYDDGVVGAGPNGLAAAITVARTGRSVLLIEAEETVGGGARSAELTLPGFRHDVCSAIYPLGAGSPFFSTLPLEEHGLEWVHPRAPLAHPLDDGTAAVLHRSVDATADALGSDGAAYRRLMGLMVADWDKLASGLLGTFRLPRHPIAMARFGLRALRSAAGLAKGLFEGSRARALFAGLGAHSMMPLERRPTAAIGLVIAIAAHTVGWPMARGGSGDLTGALASYLRSLGGEIVTGAKVDSLDELPGASAILCDLTPRQLVRIAGDRLPLTPRPVVSRCIWSRRRPRAYGFVPWA
jgi:phytoene dehydrogenase-like protein